MINLKQIIKQHPNCLSNKSAFKSILMDTHPEKKRTVNILTTIFECGIPERISRKPILDENEFLALQLQIESDYGIIPKYSAECIKIWANALDVVVKEQENSRIKETVHEEILHSPVNDIPIVEGECSEYETKVDNNEIIITKFVGFDDKEIIVPNTIDGMNVKAIGEKAFARCTGIEKLVISEGIREIHNGAFSSCTALKDVTLPTTLQKIGNVVQKKNNLFAILGWQNGAFESCAIEEIQLPVALNYIGEGTFSNCKKLKRINLPNNIETIMDGCFAGCNELVEVFLPDNLLSIEREAFSYCAMNIINIPSSVRKIGNGAFKGCRELSSVQLHEGLYEIEDLAFKDCVSLYEIRIPKTVSAIERNSFGITSGYGKNSFVFPNSNLTLLCYAGSYGLQYARDTGYKVANAAK